MLLINVVDVDGSDQPSAIRYVFRPLFGGVAKNMSAMEDLLTAEHNADINFTVVKPNHLQDTPATGWYPGSITTNTGIYIYTNSARVSEGEIFAREGQWCDGCVMSRADVARFIIDVLSTNEWDRKLVAIRTEKTPAKQDGKDSQPQAEKEPL